MSNFFGEATTHRVTVWDGPAKSTTFSMRLIGNRLVGWDGTPTFEFAGGRWHKIGDGRCSAFEVDGPTPEPR